MFQQMRIAQLRVFFVQRTDIHGDADGDLPWGDTVVFYGIADTIGQNTEFPAFIYRNVAALIQPWQRLCRFI